MTSDNYKIERALISVSDKTGIIEFAKELTELGIEIFSTGGTALALKDAGIPVKSVSELTKFPEILDGRVKTLHPIIHAGLLANLNKAEHQNQLNELGILSIDLLVVNLYPFEKALESNLDHENMIENIDIGGPTMLRAAAKNYLWTAPIINPERYNEILNLLRDRNLTLPESYRELLAEEVFEHTAYYDSLISNYFSKYNKKDSSDIFTLPFKLFQTLRYGENPHQKAALYGNWSNIFTQIHGKELSYNNIVDIDAAAKLIIEFDQPAAAIIKHTNPCGVGIGTNLSEAYQKALETDNISPFGGIIALNHEVNLETAETVHGLFTEVIIAPSFDDESLKLLTKKKDRRLVQFDISKFKNSLKDDIKSIAGGLLVQNSDNVLLDINNLKVVTKRQPSDNELASLMFGWKVAKHVKSNAVVYTKNDRTLGIGAGQMSRVDSSRIAIEKANLMKLDLKDSCVASDAFFPFADGVVEAARAGATAIIQPGGSVRDEEVIQAANDWNLAMIFTGIRHFRH